MGWRSCPAASHVDTRSAVLTDQKETLRIRLNGIDCPERDQPYGRNARESASESIGGKTVRIVTHGDDQSADEKAEVALAARKLTDLLLVRLRMIPREINLNTSGVVTLPQFFHARHSKTIGVSPAVHIVGDCATAGRAVYTVLFQKRRLATSRHRSPAVQEQDFHRGFRPVVGFLSACSTS